MAQEMLDQATCLMIQNQSRVEQEQKDMETLLSASTESIEDQKILNFSQDNNVIPKKEIKRRSDYSNTKVKTRNLLTNVSNRRFKQSDFHKNNFIIDMLSFLVQNVNLVNLDITLDTDKERETVKSLQDECIPIEFEFELIHYIYSLLFSKIYNRTNTFGIQKKNNFEFNFNLWKTKKNKKIYKQMLYKAIAKDPSNYEEREIEKSEQVPIDISISKEVVRPTMAEITTKKRAEKRKHLEDKLNENTEMIKKLKKNL